VIARLAAVNEVAEIRAAATLLQHGDHFQVAVGRLLACIADDWACSAHRPAWASEALELADAAIRCAP
jgi:hypothetical protein